MADKDNIVKEIRTQGDMTIVVLAGEIDMHCSTELRGELLEVVQSNPNVVILNMQDVEFMDSSGLAILVEVLQWSRRRKKSLRLVSLRPRVRSIFEISRLVDLFPMYDNETEAIADETRSS